MTAGMILLPLHQAANRSPSFGAVLRQFGGGTL